MSDLARLPSYPSPTTLIARSGIQFLDFGFDPVRLQPLENRYLHRKERRLRNLGSIEEVSRFRRLKDACYRPSDEREECGIDPLDTCSDERIGEQVPPHPAPLRAVSRKHQRQSSPRRTNMPVGE